MADKFSLYNLALTHLRERTLSSLTENREPRRVLDAVYASIVAQCLEGSLWRFAKRVVKIDKSTTVVPSFGVNNAFLIPPDWVRTIIVSTSEALDPPLLQYQEEAGYIYANFTPIYMSYVSNDAKYGMDLGRWPESFTQWVSLCLAVQTCGKITGSTALLDGPSGLSKREFRASRVTKANDAMNDPPGMPPVSFWVRSRRGSFQAGMPVPGFGNSG